MLTESKLISLAQDGDRSAFSELVRRHRLGVITVVYRMCGDTHLAEDMSQEAFLRAWKNLHSYMPTRPFKNWLLRIATNATLDVIRRERETVPLEEDSLSTTELNPERALSQKETSLRVQRAVLDLPPASRAVLVLREYEGFSYKEIAETLKIPLGTVMSRLNYARNALRQSLLPLAEER
jgi:RNA polymerase sigma-70 factor (ECF subfamily)